MKRYALLFFALLIWRSISAQSVTITPPVAYINQGESVTLTASGATFYQWSPAAGLSNTEGPTVVASPAVTTTYTVTGYNPSSTELVVNGDFETGNYGFTSSYQYTTNLVPEGTYYVGANANNYHPGFIGLGHGGSGNFMIINGATAPGTNVWTEQIAVSPNTNYAFSTWICNVSVGDPDVVAQLQFSINGVQLGEIFSGINQLNVWEQYYVIWNSGNTTSATITILNQNTQGGGNDFGIDDISFRALEYVADGQCTVYVDPPDIPLPDNITLANCVFFPTATEWSIAQPIISSESALTVITPVVGDIDNDGNPEICFIVGTYSDHNTGSNDLIYALKYNPSNSNGAMDIFWTTPHSDNSACTGLTLFDFNQDGYAELVYRDIAQLRIINGSLIHHQSGEPVSQPYDMATFPCCSNTQIEYPIIVDVDLDGEAEIIIGGANSMTDYGHLYIFKSGSTPWAPARKVWNQYMYNVTNVNMDLTIPQYVFNNATPFTDPQGVVRRPFNNFLQQATTIDQYGRPFYAVPDVAALTANINTSGGNATFNVTYTNQGDNTLNAPYYITVFANQFGGEVVQTITVNTPLPVGGTGQQSIPLPMSVLCQLESLTSLVVVINCNGGGIAQNGGLRPECDITNNMAQASINLQSEPTTITETACDQYAWYGQTYTQSGQYETTIPNSYGCDSTLVLYLTVNHSDTISYNITACESYEWHGQTYSQSGNYTHSTTNEFGCNRLETLDLTISDGYREEDVIEECDSYYWPVNQQWYYQNALDSVVMQGQQGSCDSTFVLKLTVNHSDTVSYNITVCESYEWHGQTYSQSGNYTHNTTNEFGCNRLETLELTISDSYRQEDVVTECDRYYWPVNQQWYYESTVDSIMVQGQQGLCDSIFVLRFTMGAGSTSSIQGPILIFPVTDIISGIYQYHLDSTGINPANVHWSIDRDDWLLVPHNASCDLLCLSIGQGILHAWTEGEPCNIDTTLVLNATFFDVGENEQASLKLYPNPTKGKITVEWNEIKVINVYDLLGQKLMACEYGKEQVCVLDLRHLQHSVYIMEIVSSAGRIIRPVVLTQ